MLLAMLFYCVFHPLLFCDPLIVLAFISNYHTVHCLVAHLNDAHLLVRLNHKLQIISSLAFLRVDLELKILAFVV